MIKCWHNILTARALFMSIRQQSNLPSFPQQKTFQIVVIHIDTFLNKGRKLRNCCARFEADSRLSFIHHYFIEVKGSAHTLATRGLVGLVWADSEMGVCQLFFFLPGIKVHVREYAFILLKLTILIITPWEWKLPFFQKSHRGMLLSAMEPETPRFAVYSSPHLTGLMDTL